MDISLLSKIVKELILDRDEVCLPGLGTFVTELAPAYFSDRGYTINPPYRHLSFRHKETPQDTSLADFYAAGNNIDKATATRIIEDFVKELRRTLESRKTVVLPGLGKLRATRENHFFFIADEDLDIYPGGFGLEPISLKTHQETQEEVSESIRHLSEILESGQEPPAGSDAADNVSVGGKEAELETVTATEEAMAEATEAAAEEQMETEVIAMSGTAATDKVAVVENIADEDIADEDIAKGNVAGKDVIVTVAETVAEDSKASHRHRNSHPYRTRRHRSRARSRRILCLKIIATVAAITILAFAVFILLSRIAPDFIDSILYSPEELRIINYEKL